MTLENKKLTNNVSLFVSKSTELSSDMNKTGSWRFSIPVYKEKTAPCTKACPAGTLIPRVEHYLSNGEVKKAFEKIAIENPFPSICGRVCFHQCESACNRGLFDFPVSINSLEKFIGDIALSEGYSFKREVEKNGKRIAVIGAGPSGLSCAYFLSKLGYSPEIFERESEPGGVMRWGIPSYRLPVDILEKEIKRLKELGVKIHLNSDLSKDSVSRLGKEFAGIYIGCGLGKSLNPEIEGSGHIGDGTLFLKQSKTSDDNMKAMNVAVIGGGNSAIDIARTAIRKGASVTILYRRRKEDMPAFIHEIKAAEKEGVKILELLMPESVRKIKGGFEIVLNVMEKGVKTDDGRFSVKKIDGKTKSMVFDRIISGIGNRIEDEWIPPQNEKLHLKYSLLDYSFEKPVVYGGDITNIEKSVTDAVASGKEAALIFDLFCKGETGIEKVLELCRVGEKALSFEIYLGRRKKDEFTADFDSLNKDYFSYAGRDEVPEIGMDEVLTSFNEVRRNYSFNTAVKEAQRCFNCGICNNCDNCRIFCPEASVLKVDEKRVILTDFCKGCGVCVAECPRSAMDMEEEKS